MKMDSGMVLNLFEINGVIVRKPSLEIGHVGRWVFDEAGQGDSMNLWLLTVIGQPIRRDGLTAASCISQAYTCVMNCITSEMSEMADGVPRSGASEMELGGPVLHLSNLTRGRFDEHIKT